MNRRRQLLNELCGGRRYDKEERVLSKLRTKANAAERKFFRAHTNFVNAKVDAEEKRVHFVEQLLAHPHAELHPIITEVRPNTSTKMRREVKMRRRIPQAPSLLDYAKISPSVLSRGVVPPTDRRSLEHLIIVANWDRIRRQNQADLQRGEQLLAEALRRRVPEAQRMSIDEFNYRYG